MVVGYVVGSPFLSLVIISKVKLNDGPHGLSARPAQGLVGEVPIFPPGSTLQYKSILAVMHE